ncbi:DUF3027 domain-containing protein [Microbacterium sp. NPDC058345]|uniref:DUF3027 domain-containing protein n=1 Tax=Microbacterium sp. NPDC058345 TaxID=3346455 RepID=UPI00364963BC
MTSTPDELAASARELALAALYEITPASTVGPAAGHVVEESGAVSLRFQNRLPGYPGWYWTVTVAQVDDAEPTVLEAELMPGDSALIAPEWVPWAERLADYRAHQAELAEQAAADEAGTPADADDSDDPDDADDDDDVTALLHAGDLDGVDIDELDDSQDDEDDDSEDDEVEDDSDDEDVEVEVESDDEDASGEADESE